MSLNEGKILIVDDDEVILLTLKLFLEQYFSAVKTIKDPSQIPTLLSKQAYDLVLLDMNFSLGETSGDEGLHWLQKISEISPDTNILLMTAYGEVDIAVKAMKVGAIDFIVKPWQNEKLLATVRSALKLTLQEKKVKRLESRERLISSDLAAHHEMIGESHALKEVANMINKVANTEAEILILGENGTGKEVAARNIHKLSNRANDAFISVDLGTIPENLFESELFGHKKGAFTDAKEDRIGRFEAASGGTLFLDEIGNLSLTLQTKLLTVLQNRKIIKVGTNNPIDIDVRVICATNSDLKERAKSGLFREDLLYRINTVTFTIPPLKDRVTDVPLLAGHFLQKYRIKYQKNDARLSETAIVALKNYSWPGNIRELQHAIERAVIMLEGDELTPGDFRFLKQNDNTTSWIDDYNLENLEAWAIKKAVKKHNGNISHAAKELGLSRGAMYRRMDKYGI